MREPSTEEDDRSSSAHKSARRIMWRDDDGQSLHARASEMMVSRKRGHGGGWYDPASDDSRGTVFMRRWRCHPKKESIKQEAMDNALRRCHCWGVHWEENELGKKRMEEGDDVWTPCVNDS